MVVGHHHRQAGHCLILAFGTVVLILTGCQSKPVEKAPLVDWNNRIGNYTHDLALQDLGTPAHEVMLANHTIVSDWITKSATPGTLNEYPMVGYTPPIVLDSPFPNHLQPTPYYHLRLTFGPDQKLRAWEKYRSFTR